MTRIITGYKDIDDAPNKIGICPFDRFKRNVFHKRRNYIGAVKEGASQEKKDRLWDDLQFALKKAREKLRYLRSL